MSEHVCGGECADGTPCQRPVARASFRCGDHPKQARADGGAVVADDGSRPEDKLSPEPAEGASVSLTSAGDPLRSFFKYPSVLVDECKLRFDSDGMHVRAVDPANVGMVDVTFPAEGFERFGVTDERVVGINLKRLRKVLRWARKGRGSDDGDPVLIDVLPDSRRLRVRVVREDSRMVRRSEWGLIDPDSIRQEPEIPDLDLPNRARPGVGALGDAVDAVGSMTDHIRVTRDAETFVVEGKGDTGEERVTLLACAWDARPAVDAEACSSLFSKDYLTDMVGVLGKAKAGDVTVQWGDEFPTVLRFTEPDWGHEGRFMLAPRVREEN